MQCCFISKSIFIYVLTKKENIEWDFNNNISLKKFFKYLIYSEQKLCLHRVSRVKINVRISNVCINNMYVVI